MADIFISYSREDAALAERLAGALEAAGYSCWWDRNLVSGSRYLAETEAQLKGSKAVVVIWSKVSVMSHWVADEAAVGRDESRLAALSFDGSMPPLGFRQFQVTDFAGWRGGAEEMAFRNLLAGLDRLVPRGVATPAASASPAARGNLPRRLEPLIGREAELAQIGALLSEASLVTLTGPGGIGKTRLAIEMARLSAPGHEDGAWLVELAPITDASAIPAAIARAMGIELRDEPAREIVERLRDWKSLILLDNCEHVIEAASGLIEQILQHAPEVRFLTTSQEILGLEGERVVRLRSLLEEDAEKLFLRAARAADPEFAPKPSDGATIKSICARLDGVALAIEMAAARAPTLGVAGLLARLDDRFRVLTAGRRTALPRQRTLQATLDWSHSLLKPSEAAVFRRLAVFAGGCTMVGACGVASDGGLDEGAVEEALASLVAKSLIVIDRSDGAPRYRLLETMRAYAQQKLAEAGETQALQRRHAEYFAAFFEPTLALRSDLELDDFGQYRAEVANLLAGLEWAFGPSGDVAMGGVLVAHGFTVFDDQQRYVDTYNWAERALSAPAELPTHIRMRLIAARSWGALQSGVPDPALIFASAQLVTEGSDPLARFLTLLTIVVTNTTLRRGVDLALVREEFEALGRTRIGGLMVDFDEIMRVYYQHPLDLLRLRAATDALVKSATQAKAKVVVFMAMANGSGTDAPWEDDPDRAIVMVRALLSDVLDTGDQSATLQMVRFLGERLVAALCRRNAPGDAEEARALVQRLLKFCSTANTDAFAHLSWLALVEERFEHAVHLLGWSRRAVAEVQHPWTSSLERQLRAAISPFDFNRLMDEGARLTSREAYDLALGTRLAAGGGRG